MASLERALAYIEWLETRAKQLEDESKALDETLKRLQAEPSVSHVNRESNESLRPEAPREEPVISVDEAENRMKEAERQKRRAQIKEAVAKAEKERDERERALAAEKEKNAVRTAGKVQEPAKKTSGGMSKNDILQGSGETDAVRTNTESEEKTSPQSRVRKAKSDPEVKKHSSETVDKSVSAPSLLPTTTQRKQKPSKKRTSSSFADVERLNEDDGINEEEKAKEAQSVIESTLVSENAERQPPPGFEPKVTGSLESLDVSISPGSTGGTARMTARASLRGMYSVVEEGSGRIFHSFDGNESASFQIIGLKLGATTTLFLRTSSGERVLGAEVKVQVPAVAPPCPPLSLMVSERQKTSVKIKWTAPIEDGGSPITLYEAELSEAETPGSFERVYEGIKTECSLSKLKVGTKYFVRVRARSALGVSPFCEPSFCFTTLGAAPSPPSAPRLVSERGTSLLITWDPPGKTGGVEIDSYQVEMASGDQDSFAVVYNDLPSEGKAIIRNLAENSTYRFRVRAHNAQGFSSWSNVSQLRTTVAPPKSVSGGPVVVDARRESLSAVSFRSKMHVIWKPVGGEVTYHLEAKPLGIPRQEWETVYIGPAHSITLTCDGNELYNRFEPGTRHLLAVSVSNERGLSPRSETYEILIRPVPPKPPVEAPRIVHCDGHRGKMTIEFDASPNAGGSAQVSSIVEVRPAAEEIKKAAPALPLKQTPKAIFFDSQQALDGYVKQSKPKPAPIPPPKFKEGETVDAVYSQDGRYYHAQVQKAVPATSLDQPHRYHVKFLGYESFEDVLEMNMRECFRKGQEITAVLYDTTPGAHAAGTTFVVKETHRRLPGEIVSYAAEGYYVRFKGKGVATQKTNAFDVFPAMVSSEVHSVAVDDHGEEEDGNNSDKVPTTEPPNDVVGGSELPADLHDREWFEACETPDLTCTLRGLRAGKMYEIRIAAVSEGGGRGEFGPVHLLKMDPGLPSAPEQPPIVLGTRSSGKVELRLSEPLEDGGASIISYQVQAVLVQTQRGAKDDEFLCVVPSFSSALTATFDSPNHASFVYPSAGVHLAIRFRAKNRVGWGAWSKLSLAIIPPAPPGPVQNLEIKNADSGLIGFTVPAELNGSALSGFVMQYRRIGGGIVRGVTKNQAEAFGNAIKVPAKGLSSTALLPTTVPGAIYEIRVAAESSEGQGPWSTMTYKASSTAPKQRPFNIHIAVKSHREFEARWEFNEQDETASGGEILFYETQFVPFPPKTMPPAQLSKDLVVEGQTSSCAYVKNSRTQLRPGQSYWFRVRASNTKGPSAYTDWVNFILPSAPEEVTNKVSIERVVLRETTTAPDLAIVLNFGLLPTMPIASKEKGLSVRFEVSERGSSASFAFECNDWTILSSDSNNDINWIACEVITGELRPDTAYICRAQFVRSGIRGELSKPVGFTTQSAPVRAAPIQVVSTSKAPVPSAAEAPKANKRDIKKLKRRGSSKGSSPDMSFWDSLGASPVFIVLLSLMVSAADIYLCMVGLVFAMVHAFVFFKLIPPGGKSKGSASKKTSNEEGGYRVDYLISKRRELQVFSVLVYLSICVFYFPIEVFPELLASGRFVAILGLPTCLWFVYYGQQA